MSEEEKVYRYVDAEVEVSKSGDQANILVKSTDGSPLTAQEILDAVADTVLYIYVDELPADKRRFDA